MSCRSVVLCLLAGCGRAGFEPVADAPPDAPPDAPLCPSTYTVTVDSSSTRYRIVSTDMSPRAHHDACASDAPSGTHLVVYDSIAEQAELRVVLQTVPAPTSDRFYVGAVQLPGQSVPTTGWVWITGEPVDSRLWRATEPQDLDNIEDEEEQVSVVDATGQLVDVRGGTPYGGICECDGRALDPTAVSALP